MAKYFSPKRPTERLALTFDFKNVLGSSETISTAAWSMEVIEGTDPDPTTTMVYGAAAISDTKVTQLIDSGVDDVLYRVVCKITTSADQVIEGIALLQIEEEKSE